MTVRAQFDGKALIPLDVEPLALQPGQIYELEVREAGFIAGSPQIILAVLDSLPKIAGADIDAMDREIEQARRPARFNAIFGDDGAS